MDVQLVLCTCACSFTRTPPNVNVIPPVTGHAVKGGVSRRCAQFDFGSASPVVASPSLHGGIEGRRPHRGVVRLERLQAAGLVHRQLRDQRGEGVGDDRLSGL